MEIIHLEPIDGAAVDQRREVAHAIKRNQMQLALNTLGYAVSDYLSRRLEPKGLKAKTKWRRSLHCWAKKVINPAGLASLLGPLFR